MDAHFPERSVKATRDAASELALEADAEGVLVRGAEILGATGAPWVGAWVVEEGGWLRRVSVAESGPTELDWLARAAVDGVVTHDAGEVGVGGWARRLGASRVVVAACGAGAGRRGVLACLEGGAPEPERNALVGLVADLVGGFCAALEVRRLAEAERSRLAERLLHFQRLEGIGLCASGVAHDFNNLLAVIVGNASLASTRLDPESRERGLLQEIVATAQRGEELTHQLLSYSGSAPFRCETLDLAAQVAAVGALLRTVLPRRVWLHTELASAWVEADAAQVQQVALNLVTNAAEALGERAGSVWLRTGCSLLDGADLERELGVDRIAGRYSWIEVEDDGPGMPAHVQDHIFDPFFSTKGAGRGLGLPAVREIARCHDGTVRVDSEANRGSRLRVWFPAASVEDEAHADGPEEGGYAGAGLVLVVDDLPDVRATARLMLEHLGYGVIEAGDGAEALSRVEELGDTLAAILLDVSMPVLDGEGMLEALREQRCPVPVVLSSGYNQTEAIERIAAKGACFFLQKPYTVQQLGRALSLAVDASAQRP